MKTNGIESIFNINILLLKQKEEKTHAAVNRKETIFGF